MNAPVAPTAASGQYVTVTFFALCKLRTNVFGHVSWIIVIIHEMGVAASSDESNGLCPLSLQSGDTSVVNYSAAYGVPASRFRVFEMWWL
jgi:hypothetical protein